MATKKTRATGTAQKKVPRKGARRPTRRDPMRLTVRDVLDMTEGRVDSAYETLVRDVHRLYQQMRWLRKRLEAGGVDARFNTVGEVQDLGLRVDRALGILAEQRSMRNSLRLELSQARRKKRAS